jgi:hypothetical protein
LTFAWCARALPVRRVAEAQGWSDIEIDALEQFRDHLVGRAIAESQTRQLDVITSPSGVQACPT